MIAALEIFGLYLCAAAIAVTCFWTTQIVFGDISDLDPQSLPVRILRRFRSVASAEKQDPSDSHPLAVKEGFPPKEAPVLPEGLLPEGLAVERYLRRALVLSHRTGIEPKQEFLNALIEQLQGSFQTSLSVGPREANESRRAVLKKIRAQLKEQSEQEERGTSNPSLAAIKYFRIAQLSGSPGGTGFQKPDKYTVN